MRRIAANTIRIVAIVMVVGMAMVLCFTLGRGILYGLWDIPDQLNWRAKTTPLEQSVIDDICLKFAVPADDRRCQPNAVVDAPEFFGDITSAFREHDGNWSTYDDVQQKLGRYQFAYDPLVTQADGMSYFRAHYDLRGDRVFPITMFYYEDGRLFRIIAKLGD